MKMRILAGIALAWLAFPLLAQETYECRIEDLGVNNGWLPEVVVAKVAPDRATATVSDPIILHYVGSPTTAKTDVDNDKRMTLVWRLKAKSTSNNYATLVYRLTIIKNDLRAVLSMLPLGYDDRLSAQGICKKLRG